MTQYTINYITKDGDEITIPIERNSIKSVWTTAQKVAGKQFYTVKVTVL